MPPNAILLGMGVAPGADGAPAENLVELEDGLANWAFEDGSEIEWG